MTFSGTDELAEMLDNLAENTNAVAHQILYAGAGVVADAVTAATNTLPTEEPHATARANNARQYNVITDAERDELAKHVYIGRHKRDSEDISTMVTFTGYMTRKEKKFPQGVPAALIARSIESGSSVRRKHPFVRRAVNAVKDQVQAAMEAAAREKIKELTDN